MNSFLMRPTQTMTCTDSSIPSATATTVAVGKGTPPAPPPKPPIHSKKKRPESIQILSPPSSSNGGGSLGVFSGGSTTSTASIFDEAKNSIFASTSSPTSGHRRSSYSASFGAAGAGGSGDSTASTTTTTTGTIQRKLQELQLNAMPVLEKARYKAEAGLSPRRGFIPSSSSSAVNGASGTGAAGVGMTGSKRSISLGRSRGEDREGLLLSPDAGQDSGDNDDDGDADFGVGYDDRDATLRARRPQVLLRDEMKWPAGEGWNRL